ncbi:hypothetical protein L2D14_02770 [Thalassospiraceae bacterium LMO-JJ14]|nr:hypothetical protein L2D14_02770 [Thalassospiraceae bacterium LMO-JJ14]
MTDTAKGTLRTASIDDAPAITDFLAALGLVMPDGPEAVIRHWRGLWVDNPALSHHARDVALGWVLEDGGAIKGFFGNIPQVSWQGDTPVLISSARAWAVDPGYRTETPRLCEAFFGQTNVDVVLISSANPPAGKRCLAYGGAKMPQPGYADILYWVVDAPGFLKAAFRKKGRGNFMAGLLGLLGSVPLDFSMRIAGRRPYGALDKITPVGVSAIDDAFDNLWTRRKKQLADVLLASRDAETLKWYFSLGAASDEVRFLRYDDDGMLKGYAVLVREDAPAIGLKRMKIADIFIDGDDPKVLQALLAGAYEYAIAKRCHVLELIGLPEGLRAEAMKTKPMSRPMATFPFFYKAMSGEMAARLGDPAAWYVTAYDGDTSLI